MKKPTQYRQGDVLLEKATLPKNKKPVKPDGRGRFVLAEGEATGHAHAISAKTTRFYQTQVGESVERFLRVVKTTCLQHEEHPAIELPAGTYKVIRQREYTPERIRTVAD